MNFPYLNIPEREKEDRLFMFTPIRMKHSTFWKENISFNAETIKISLTEGDMIFLPKGVPHTWAQLTESGKLLYFFQPAGKMEEFFETVGNQKGVLTPDEGKKLWEDHEMKIVGSPLDF